MYECNVVRLNIQLSQGSAATKFRCGGRFYCTVFCSLSTNPKVKELLKSVHICQSYRKNKSGTFFMAHGVQESLAHAKDKHANATALLVESGFWHEIAIQGHSRPFILQSITGRHGVAYGHVILLASMSFRRSNHPNPQKLPSSTTPL